MSITCFSLFFLIVAGARSGSGHPREEALLQDGHEYYVVERFGVLTVGQSVLIGLHDRTSNEYLLWSFKRVPPGAFRVIVKNGIREYEIVVQNRSQNQFLLSKNYFHHA